MAKLTNNILLSTIVALLTWSWVSYITSWQLLAILASVSTTALYIALTAKVADNHQPKTRLVDSLSIYMATNKQYTGLVVSMLKYYLYNVDIATPYINATKNNNTTTLCCCQSLSPLGEKTATDIVEYCQTNKINCITIIATDIDRNAHTIFNYYNIKAKHISISSLYNMLDKASLLPRLHPTKVNKKGIVANYALNKNRSKHYAISAVFLLIISRLSYIPIYSLLWATALFCLAVYSRYNKKYNKPYTNSLHL